MSEKDIMKINSMYGDKCNNDTIDTVAVYEMMQQLQQEVVPTKLPDNYFDTVIKWFESLIETGIDLIFQKNQL